MKNQPIAAVFCCDLDKTLRGSIISRRVKNRNQGEEEMADKKVDLGLLDLLAITESDPRERISLLRECYARHFSETMKNKMRLQDMEFKLEELIEALKKVKKATSHPEKEESAQIIAIYLVTAGKLWKEIMDEIKSWGD